MSDRNNRIASALVITAGLFFVTAVILFVGAFMAGSHKPDFVQQIVTGALVTAFGLVSLLLANKVRR